MVSSTGQKKNIRWWSLIKWMISFFYLSAQNCSRLHSPCCESPPSGLIAEITDLNMATYLRFAWETTLSSDLVQKKLSSLILLSPVQELIWVRGFIQNLCCHFLLILSYSEEVINNVLSSLPECLNLSQKHQRQWVGMWHFILGARKMKRMPNQKG